MIPGERYSLKGRSADIANKQVEAAGKLVGAVLCQSDSRLTSHQLLQRDGKVSANL
jgi:hypothetical protein